MLGIDDVIADRLALVLKLRAAVMIVRAETSVIEGELHLAGRGDDPIGRAKHGRVVSDEDSALGPGRPRREEHRQCEERCRHEPVRARGCPSNGFPGHLSHP